MTALERLMAKVIPEPNSGCWLWIGAIGGLKPHLYGYMYFKGKNHRAHRISYELHRGPIPKGLEIDHLCKVTYCINPDHLEAVTKSVNNKRSSSGDALRIRQTSKTHCPQGHSYDETNTVIYRGRRGCRTCRRVYIRNWSRKHRSNPDV